VCDGAAVPANPGVNPSLTITALAEHAMSHVPPGPRAGSVPPVRAHVEPPPAVKIPAPGTASGA
jgi:cholesterol oxidase